MIGILAASEDELQPVLDAMLIHELGRKSRLVFHVGTVGGIEAVAAFSGVGKVNAAIAAQCMIDLFNPARLNVTGVAGALGGPYGIGDTVLVRRVAHHDLEPGVLTAYHPFMPSEWYELASIHPDLASSCGIAEVTLVCGEFFVTQADKLRLREAFGAQCVDMESAAYAQVCYANDTPLTIIKTVSDQCDENGFENFEKNVAHCSTISATTLLGLIGREHAA